MPRDSGESQVRRLEMRAVHLLDNFAGNWEISDMKNRLVDQALLFLVAALVGIVALAGLLIVAVA
jgi:hypothetical protein